MKIRKLLSMLLITSLLTTMAMPVFGADEVATATDVSPNFTPNIEAGVATPKLIVSLPVISNDSLKFDVFNVGGGSQMLSQNLIFANYSTAPVELTLKSYTVVGSSTDAAHPLTVATDTDSVENADGEKYMYLWINEADKDDNGNLVDTDAVTTGIQYSYPVYSADFATRVLDTFGTATDITAPVAFTEMDRGKIAHPSLDDNQAVAIDPIELGSKHKTVVKFDGALNTQASWLTDDVIKITPVFSLKLNKIVEAPVITTDKDSIEIGATGATIVVTGVGLKNAATATDWKIDPGTTNLVLASANIASNSTATFTFTGTAAAGKITIQATTDAYDSAPEKASKVITIPVVAPASKLTVGTVTAASTFSGMSGGTLGINTSLPAKTATLAATDVEVKYTNASNVTTTLTPSAVTYANNVISVKVKTTAAAAVGDKFTVTVKSSAYASGVSTDTAPLVITLAN